MPNVPALINSQFGKKYFPGVNPIGQRFGAEYGSDPKRSKGPGYEVIGIVGDAKYNSLRRAIDPTMYVPLSGQAADFEVRTAGFFALRVLLKSVQESELHAVTPRRFAPRRKKAATWNTRSAA